MGRKMNGKAVTIWVPVDVLERLDEMARKCRMSRSRLCSNMVVVGLEELGQMDALGMIALSRAIEAFMEKFQAEREAAKGGVQVA